MPAFVTSLYAKRRYFVFPGWDLFNIFLLCCAIIADAFMVTVPERQVLALRGQPVVLGCSYTPDPSGNLDGLVVTWQRVGDSTVLHSFYYGQDQLEQQSPKYRNRTTLFLSQLGAGNASLRLDQVTPQDSGRYLCYVSSLKGTSRAELQLEYAAFYAEPRLSIVVLSSSISFQFESEGYPAAEVQWTDASGQNLSHDQEVTYDTREDGLLLLRTRLTMKDPAPVANLSFSLRNSVLAQALERPVSFSLARDAVTSSGNLMAIPLILCGSLLLLCVLAFVYWRHRKSQKTKSSDVRRSNSISMNVTNE
ncbi:hypothetical protein AGOR_G00103030 [Albula goreensis]|uniref:Ig-like domain-containing protein n=1 Tax=Albula goreensis TaxID=1534307 RepID=A0A8T3DE85_9TELE|nr:hypothetical protein AGOR_G00103030 [Albula goreensis]